MNTPSKPIPIAASSRSRRRAADQLTTNTSPASLRIMPQEDPVPGPNPRRNTPKRMPTPTHVAAAASVTMADLAQLFTRLSAFMRQCGQDVPTYSSAGLDGRVALTDGQLPLLPDLPSATISDPRHVVALMRPLLAGLVQEQVWLLLLNIRSQVLGRVLVYQGSVDTACVRVSEVLRPAILLNAPSLILCHNHPGGSLAPSKADIDVTTRVYQAADLHGMELLDHLILAGNGYVSLRARGLGFPDSRDAPSATVYNVLERSATLTFAPCDPIPTPPHDPHSP